MTKIVSLVVLNWNGKKFIDGFLKTLSKQTYPFESLELLFVDNASIDSSVEYFRSVITKYPEISYKIVKNDKNYGYAGGNNKGIKHATGDYILVCNNDLELHPDLIKELVAIADNNDSAVTVPKLMYLNKIGYINNAGSRIDASSAWPIFEIGANEKDTGQYNKVREITAFCGACALFSRKFLENVGMFDSKFFMYFEDGDLSWRGQRAGFKFFYAPRAVAFHHHTGSSKEGSPLFNHFVGRNRILILTKNGDFRVIIKVWLATYKDHFLLRIRQLLLSFFNKHPSRLAMKEFILSQKMIMAAILMTPYALCKRLGIIKEETL